MEWIFVIIVIGAVLLWYITTRNSLRRAEVKIDEALSDIDVALIKRNDVLVKMLDISKSYAKYEKETILATINLRSGLSMADRKQLSDEMNKLNDFISAVAENYPELRSSENFKQLQISVMDVEEHLQAARRLYNGNVSSLNQKIASFPGSLVAKQLKLLPREFIEAEDKKKQDVRMEF